MNWLTALDAMAETSTGNEAARLLDRIAFGGLVLLAVGAPHSIAVTQGAWLLSMTAFVVRLFLKPRPSLRLTAVGIGLLAFFGWTAVSAAFSYEPAVSIDKLRAPSVLLIFILAVNLIRNRRAAHFVAFALLCSCMVAVAWTPVQKLIGRGVELSQLSPASPLIRLGVKDGDVIVRADGKRVHSPAEVIASFQGKDSVELEMNRLDGVYRIKLPRPALLEGPTDEGKLGFGSWKRGRGFRAAGFYGHFTTFAEMLQLVGSLAFGLLIAALMASAPVRATAALAVSVGGIGFALLLSVTRASQLAFVISSGVTVLLGASRKVILICAVLAIPVSALGLFYLQNQRQVGFFDAKDGSIMWRQMMWRDGFRLLTEKPRHLIVGVGMESIKTHWLEWGFFDKGHQPMGHFHSTPLQLAVERGIPALILWLIVLGIYARTLWQGLRRDQGTDWRTTGILLGCAGGLIGFFASGIVHYNLGDNEVAMTFYLLMAIGVSLSLMPNAVDVLIADSPILQPGPITL
jgi:hypothetical protein